MKKEVILFMLGVFLMVFMTLGILAESSTPSNSGSGGSRGIPATNGSNSSGGGGGGGGSVTYTIYTITESMLMKGYTKELSNKSQVKFNFLGENHSVSINDVTSSLVDLNVSSIPKRASFNIGDEKLFDLNNDGYNDLSIKLNSINISSLKVNLTIMSINPIKCGDTITKDTILTQDLLNCTGHGLVIGADKINLDCNGSTIEGLNKSSQYFGIYLDNRRYVTIKNCSIRNFYNGIYLDSSWDNSIINNKIHENSNTGIYSITGLRNNFEKNIVEGGYFGIYIKSGKDNTITENLVNNNSDCSSISGWLCPASGIIIQSSS